MRNRAVTARKSRVLRVTIASAFPWYAASSTNSSLGSTSCGRKRRAICTGSPVFTITFKRSVIASSSRSEACTCSGRVRTASYSRTKETEISGLSCSSSTILKSSRDAPLLLRIPATRTDVSSTNRTNDHITCNITRPAQHSGAQIPIVSAGKTGASVHAVRF